MGTKQKKGLVLFNAMVMKENVSPFVENELM